MEPLKMDSHATSWNDDRIDELAGGVRDGFVKVDGRFDKVDGRFNRVDERFTEVDERFDKVDERFAEVDERFDKVERDMEAGFARVDKRFAETPTRQEMNDGFAELRAAFTALNRTLIAGAFVIVAALIGIHAF
jgi:hypothetical protein